MMVVSSFIIICITQLLKFDRSIYDVPEVGDIVVVQKDFYYDGKSITKPQKLSLMSWVKIKKGTEMVILDVKETDGDWNIRLIEKGFEKTQNVPFWMQINLLYLDTKDYWDTKANIRNRILSKLGI